MEAAEMKTGVKILPASQEQIKAELERISNAMRENQNDKMLWPQLYAAQQALAWVGDPNGFMSPFGSITTRQVPLVTDNQEG